MLCDKKESKCMAGSGKRDHRPGKHPGNEQLTCASKGHIDSEAPRKEVDYVTWGLSGWAGSH